MGNCVIHKSRPGTYKCEFCNAELCDECYSLIKFHDDDGNEHHSCDKCYIENAKTCIFNNEVVKKGYKGELACIIVGFIVGLIIGIIVAVKYSKLSGSILTYSILFPIWITFTCASFVTIIRKIKTEYNKEKDVSQGKYSGSFNIITLLMIIIVNIIGSPVLTIVRIFNVLSGIKDADHMIKELTEAINNLEEGFRKMREE